MMTSLFDDLKLGLEQAIMYETDGGSFHEKTYTISPVKRYTNSEIRDIRMKAGMTQKVFALYMGVTNKAVEAWECGRTHPTGSACRLLEVLEKSNYKGMDFIINNDQGNI